MGHVDLLTTVQLSVRVGLAATAVNLALALPVAYALARWKFAGKSIVEGIVNLPLVMPPVATGYLLLLLLGRRGVIGSLLYARFGTSIAFSSGAAVVAAIVVSFPLVVRSIRIAVAAVDTRLEEAAMSLGASRVGVWLRVTLPLAVSGIAGGAILGFARSLGEFGATMVFAGNIEGETRTLPLSVYSLLQVPGKEREAALLVLVSVGISLLATLVSSVVTRRVGSAES